MASPWSEVWRGGAAEEPREQVGMFGSIGKSAEALGEFVLDKRSRPVARRVANAKVEVVNLDVTKVVRDDLGHRPWACRLVTPIRTQAI